MRRGGLFFIGLISAIVTIVSLNMTLGRSPFYDRYHHCNYGYDRHYRTNKSYQNEKHRQTDSLNSNY